MINVNPQYYSDLIAVDELRDYLLIINSLINYIDESYIQTRILMKTNESRSIPRHELSSSKLI